MTSYLKNVREEIIQKQTHCQPLLFYINSFNNLSTERHFYLALNGSCQDEDDYLVWVETDNKGRILGRVRGRNWGKADKNEYEQRYDNAEMFKRDDGTFVHVVNMTDSQVTLYYVKLPDDFQQRVYNVRKPWVGDKQNLFSAEQVSLNTFNEDLSGIKDELWFDDEKDDCRLDDEEPESFVEEDELSSEEDQHTPENWYDEI